MIKGKYLITLISASNRKNYSALITKSKISIILALVSIIYFIVYYPIIQHLNSKQLQIQLKTAETENATMRQEFFIWRHRIKKAEASLNLLKNNYATLTEDEIDITGDAEMGLGGIEENPIFDVTDELYDRSKLNILELEKEIKQFKFRVAEIQVNLKDNRELIDHFPSISPVKGGWISSGFGYRQDPFTQEKEMHKGMDFSVRMNTKVAAAANGVVHKVNDRVIKNKGYGRYVIIDHGYGYKTLYAHLEKINVKVGQTVKRWDIIAYSGNSGKSTAPHLHYAVYENGKAKNPQHFILNDTQ